MFNIGPMELMVILVIALLVVGPSKLPEVGRSIGRGLREFRKAQDEVQRTLRLSLDDEPAPRPVRAATTSTDVASGTPDEPADEPAATSPTERGSEPPSEVEDLAKVLGRGLAELRRAKEELQNSFRVDLGDGDGRGRPGR